MLPIGPLMIEHRLIERMIKIMNSELEKMEKEGIMNLRFIEEAVDFIKTYADRCHHGKEEGILFRELEKKKMSREHRRAMEELIEDHKLGRELTRSLTEAREKAAEGDVSQVTSVAGIMKKLVTFYPKHIEKEDKQFFMPVMGYFTESEKDEMLQEEYDFDRKLVHDKYKELIEKWE